jgi:quercetin dioxygenase-like cupin family protein
MLRRSGDHAKPTKGHPVTADTTPWDWPDELDALTAAPANHEHLFENDRVRVLETVVPIGARTPVHTHCWSSVEYVLSGTQFVRRDRDGTVLFDTRTAHAEPHRADVLWSEPLAPHSLENVGDRELRVIMIEVKAPGSD